VNEGRHEKLSLGDLTHTFACTKREYNNTSGNSGIAE